VSTSRLPYQSGKIFWDWRQHSRSNSNSSDQDTYLQVLLKSLFTGYSCPGVVFFLELCDNRCRLVPEGPSGHHTSLLKHLLCCCADGRFGYETERPKCVADRPWCCTTA
jgi:hypothetical protein